MPQLRLNTFGGLWVEDSGRSLGPASGQPKRLALLALISRSKPPGMSRDQLLALLWPESDAAHARNALNQAIHSLRRDLLTDAVVEGGQVLRLNPAVITGDVAEFEAACQQGDFERAVGLYAGPFLDGFHLQEVPDFERWVDDQRSEIRKQAVMAARRLAERAHSAGDFAAAEDWARRAQAIDPHDEATLRRLLEILGDAGDRAGAARAYQEFAQRLQLDFEVAPSAETQALFEQIRRSAGTAPASTAAEPDPQLNGTASIPTPSVPVPSPRRSRGTLLRGALGVGAVGAILAFVAWRGSTRSSFSATDSTVTVAVSPFTSLGPDTGRSYLSAGTTDQVALYLSRISGIKVASPAAVAELIQAKKTIREMADQLKASVIVSGSVSTSGDRLRIIAQVDDPRTGRRLWAENYDRTVNDVFAVQGEIALSIAQTLGIRLNAEQKRRVASPPTTNVKADALWRLARGHSDGVPDLGRAENSLKLQREVVALDPQFAVVYNDMAGSFMWISYFKGNVDFADSILAYSQHALQLGLDRDEQAVAYRLGSLAYDQRYSYRKAIELNRQALQVKGGAFWPTQGIGYDFLALGRADSAHSWVQQAFSLGPDRISAGLLRAWVFISADSLPGAEARIRENLKAFPENVTPYMSLARYHLLRGDPQQALMAVKDPMAPPPGRRFDGQPQEPLGAAIAASLQLGQYRQVEQLYRRLLREDPPPEDSLGRPSTDEWTCHRVGTDWAFARWVGRHDQGGRQLLEEIRARDLKQVAKGAEEPCFLYEAGAISAALGDSTEALRRLGAAAAAGWRYYRYARFDPLLARLRGHPEFERLLAEVADSAAAMRNWIAASRP